MGAWYLHMSSIGHSSTSKVVYFSSAASSFGSPGQVNYAIANAFLDGLSSMRQSMGLLTSVFNWGSWADVGLAASLAEEHRNVGLDPLTPQQGIEAFNWLLENQVEQSIIVKLNENFKVTKGVLHWPQSVKKPTQRSVEKQKETRVVMQDTQVMPTIGEEQLEKKWTTQRAVKETIEQVLHIVLGASSEGQIVENQGFMEMGMDSLITIEFR